MCVAQRPSVSDVPKGTLYHHLIFKGLGRGSGELCHHLASTQTHTEGGFGPASRNQRSLGRHPGLDPPPTRLRRTGRVPAHAARHQWADPPPSTTTTSLLLLLIPTKPTRPPAKPPPPTACPFASWPQLDGGDGIWTQLRHRVSTFHRWLGEALHGGEETEREKRESERERESRRRSGADFTPR